MRELAKSSGMRLPALPWPRPRASRGVTSGDVREVARQARSHFAGDGAPAAKSWGAARIEPTLIPQTGAPRPRSPGGPGAGGFAIRSDSKPGGPSAPAKLAFRRCGALSLLPPNSALAPLRLRAHALVPPAEHNSKHLNTNLPFHQGGDGGRKRLLLLLGLHDVARGAGALAGLCWVKFWWTPVERASPDNAKPRGGEGEASEPGRKRTAAAQLGPGGK